MADPHPIKAIPQEEGMVLLVGGTYDRKDEIKAAGGRWDKDAKGWRIGAVEAATFADPFEDEEPALPGLDGDFFGEP